MPRRRTALGVLGFATVAAAADACSQCKVTPGRDWTYTIFQPLVGYEPASAGSWARSEASLAVQTGLTVDMNGTKETLYLSPANPHVAVVDGGAAVQMGFGARVYVMVTPNLPNSSSKRSDFKEFVLLGKEIGVTVDLNGASCGCNAAFYLTSMPSAAGSPGHDHDWYCDANTVGGNSCPEMDLIEANMNGLHSTAHTCRRPWNETNCDKGGWASRFGQGRPDFGIGPRFTIDTTRPFRVSNAFRTNANGTLVAIVTTITQGAATVKGTLDSVLLDQMQADFRAGMVLIMSYWGATSMGWLDSPPCTSDPERCPASITFSQITVGPAAPASGPGKCCSWGSGKCGSSEYCNGSESDCDGCGGKWIVPSTA